MKHLDEYKIFENKIGDFLRDSKIKSICKKYNIENYTINDDGSIDVHGDIELINGGPICKRLTELPLKFNRITGDFNCSGNNLTSLERCPRHVGGSFYCSDNKITTLEGGPKYVGGDFSCSGNKITSLEGFPEHLGSTFHCYINPVFSVVQYFIYNENNRDNLVELFNYYDIIQDMNVIYDRLVFFYEGIGINVADHYMLREIEKNGYKIIY